MADQVELTDLEVISRWSIAVRAATADRSELVAALEADLRWLRGDDGPAAASRTARAAPVELLTSSPAAPIRKAAAKAQPRKSAAKQPAVTKSTANRAAPRKSR